MTFWLWFGKIFSDGRSGNPSTKRFAHVIAAITLCVCCLVLTMGLVHSPDRELSYALAICVSGLVILAGFGYVLGKLVERLPGGSASAQVVQNCRLQPSAPVTEPAKSTPGDQ